MEKPRVEPTLNFTPLVLEFSDASYGAYCKRNLRDLGSCHKGLYVAWKGAGKAKTIGGSSFVAPKKKLYVCGGD